VCTSGPWEFYRDSEGVRKPYGHPVPASEEARRRGIHGLSGVLYCPDCDRVSDLILVEFKKPSQDGLSVWAGTCEPKDEFKTKGALACPNCGNKKLVLEPVEGREVTCPRCKEAILEGRMEWIS